ncbi:zinc finger CW-type PWWP domain protein 1 isoform X5 [Ursus americanus]|uniref:zinc finger CW-type PWWP domain protein 1 isoform X5 n=1 Tax=Ursus americanus TaxID=9643 RepID=UPI001CF8E602|nr:zinc finger CW-type PWWP domain protein 1 isoform X5 [Ursus americanus]
MMTTLQSKEECGKGPKKTFAPPAQKLHSLMCYSPDPPKEETLGISSPKARLEKKEEKATTENGPSSGQENKGKPQDKQAEKKEKEISSLTNAEFEEIVQIVLRKSLQECLGQCLVWVQCSSPDCEKWRRLCGNIDPSVLPANWSCDQNTDSRYNRCDIPEESWTGLESDVAYASYIPGSIIWAKQYGYPWWPGMVESDPDLGEYFLFASHLDSLPSKYHVTFFGETVSRAWIPVNMLKNFQELSLELAGGKKFRNKDCNQKLGAALTMAQEAERINIQERVNLFGFRSRYTGSDSSGEGKDLRLSGANSPDSCLEKEEEESELEAEELEEEEEKKDPTLPSPKPAKIQTKKPKARGIGGDADGRDGRDGTLQKKTMKRSLGNESAAPSGPIIGRKEGHGKSEPDQPGPKKKFKAPQSKASITSLSEDKEARMVPKDLTPSAHRGACPVVGKEGWKCPREAGSVPPDDEASSDLDLEQLLEDVGEEPEQLEEPRCGDAAGEFTLAFFEE